MMFHRTQIKNKAPEDRVHLCGNNLVSVSNTKFLCIIIDCKLNWSDHITNILKKHRNFNLNKKILKQNNSEKSIFFICVSIRHLLH